MHPKFMRYVTTQELQAEPTEGYVFLNKNLEILTQEELFITKAKEGDELYLVPAIVGGGGKRGGLLAIFAIFALIVFTGGLGLGAMGAGTAAGSTAAAGAGATGGGFFGTIFNAFKALPGFMKSMIGNIAMSAITKSFQRQPQQSESEAIRENGVFGPLSNSSTSGTPVALHYGMPRVSGQFLSGYIESTEHGKSDVVKVGDQF